MKLRHKTILFITPFIIIPIVMVGAVSFYKLKESAEERFSTQVVTLLDQISQFINHKVDIAEANLNLLAEHQLVTKYALTDDESIRYELLLPHLLNAFKNLQISINDYYEIRFILPDGFEDARWSANGIENKSEDVSEEDWFKKIKSKNNGVYKSIILDGNTGQAGLLIARKMVLNDAAVDGYGESPKLRGYLAITVSLDYLRTEINKDIIGNTGFLTVMSSRGELIIKPARKIQILSYENLVWEISALIKNNRGKEGLFEIKLNEENLLIHSKILPAEMHLLGILPSRDILDSSRDLGKLVLIITLIAILVTMVSIFFALRHLILRPLSVLNTAARSIGNGHLDLDIEINSKDEIGSLANTFMEMSQSLRQTHEEVSYTANHDSLTGLPNRGMFQKHLSNILTIAKQKGHKVALLFIDLDDFKHINDTLGHQAGDILLQEVALRLSGTLRKKAAAGIHVTGDKACDLVARLGGDEFIILLNEIDGPFNATAVADRVLKKLEKPIDINNHQAYANCSIGITIFPGDAEDSNELIKHADIAMYHAKEQGKNHYQFYSTKLNNDMQKQMQINSRLRIALEQGNFFLHYQPKFDVNTEHVVGLEALIRWNDSELGEVSPAVFIPIAEESGLITPITEWVLNEVCRQCIAWLDAGHKIVPVAVNISSIQFQRRDLLGMINSCLHKSSLSAKFLEVELTETSLLTDTEDAIKILKGLNDLDIKVALDDFGTGYSSLSYLNELPIQTLKIDRSFIKNIVSVNDEYAIIDAIIALAHALDLQVIAEGVETTDQLEYLRKHKCDHVQGFLLSKPLSSDEISQLLKSKNIDRSIS